MANTENTQEDHNEDNQEELVPAWVSTLSQTITQSVREALQELNNQTSLTYPTLEQITEAVKQSLSSGKEVDQKEAETSQNNISQNQLEETIKRVMSELLPPKQENKVENIQTTKLPFLYKARKQVRNVDESR